MLGLGGPDILGPHYPATDGLHGSPLLHIRIWKLNNDRLLSLWPEYCLNYADLI